MTRDVEQRGLYYEELEPDVRYVHRPGRTMTEADNVLFSTLTMNPQALHLDAAWSAEQPFGQRLVNSMMTLSVLVGSSVAQLTQGTIVGNLGFSDVAFPKPLFHGDTLYAEAPVTFPAIPSFAPELFVVARSKDISRYKQFQRGITELDGEGVVQVLRSDLRGDQAPVLAAVGPMQFEVVSHRMSADFNADVSLEPLPYTLAHRTDAASAAFLHRQRDVEVLARPDGTLLALFTDLWRVRGVQREHPEITLHPLAAGSDGL
jgi:acyl dehydratase